MTEVTSKDAKGKGMRSRTRKCLQQVLIYVDYDIVFCFSGLCNVKYVIVPEIEVNNLK